ncbi:MAG: hypothetical protein KOO66_00670 [Bacteroidales bacterium]|nr:hypothetical protein [Bacteroidales bacterium]
MNNNKLNSDTYTRKLVNMGGLEQPGSDFTKNVMSQILKDPSVKVSFITNDDKKSNIWLFIAIGAMTIGYSIFYYIKNGFSFTSDTGAIETPGYFKVFSQFFSGLFNELSLSPYILIALIGVVVLVVLDKTIVRYLYSI